MVNGLASTVQSGTTTGAPAATPQQAQQSTTPSSGSCLFTKPLRVLPHRTQYAAFGNETVRSDLGYGVYYANAEIALSCVECDSGAKALRIEYTLPPHFSWGNWASIRRELLSPIDLTGCTGIQLDLKVETPSHAQLRITLGDVDPQQTGKKPVRDEMWWYDFRPDLLTKPTAWITLRAPFIDFGPCYGAGCRANNRVLDPTVIGYEINLVSEAGKTEAGVILVRNIRAY
jgi:hypothetical protein